MSSAAQADAEERAELRPQRLGVSHLPQVAADRPTAPAVLVARQLVVGAAARRAPRRLLRGKHAGPHGVVGALDAGHVEKARAVADQRAAGKREVRHRLPAAFHDGARAVADALAARESSRTSGWVLKRWNSSNGDR